MAFVPYQVDHKNENVSKTLGFSKKRVAFRFGLASSASLAQGKTGAQCRGSEHEVVFVWSLKSGKRWLYLDGKEIHFSESGMNGWTVDRAWQHAFPLRDSGGGSYKMHFVSQPVNKEIPDARPFDLRMNGTSFFNFNEIWKLGTPSMTSRDSPSRGHHHRGHRSRDRDAHLSHEERRQIAAAKLESLRDLAEQKEKNKNGGAGGGDRASMVREEASLISFDNDPAPPQQVVQVQQQQQQQGMERARSTSSGGGSGYFQPNMSSMTMDPNDFTASGQPHQQQQPYLGYGGGGMPGPYGQPPPQGQEAPPPQQPNPFGAPVPAAPPAAPTGSMFDPMASVTSQSSSTAMTPYTPSPQQPPQSAGYAMGSPPPPAAPAPAPVYGGYGQAAPTQQQQPYGTPGSVGGGSLPPQLGSPSAQSTNSYVTYGSGAPSFAQPPRAPAAAQAYPPAGYPSRAGQPQAYSPAQHTPPPAPQGYPQQQPYPHQPAY